MITVAQALALRCVAMGDPYHGVRGVKIRPITARSKVLGRMIEAGYVLTKRGTEELSLTESGETALAAAIAQNKGV